MHATWLDLIPCTYEELGSSQMESRNLDQSSTIFGKSCGSVDPVGHSLRLNPENTFIHYSDSVKIYLMIC